jgi:hypothetical protein
LHSALNDRVFDADQFGESRFDHPDTRLVLVRL